MENKPDVQTAIPDSAVKNLTIGLLEIYEEPLKKISTNLKELTDKQKELICKVETQNRKLDNTLNSDAVKHLFTDIHSCRERLTLIKKQMTQLHEKSTKLKVRSQNVLNRAMNKHTMRVQELEREQRLIGGQSSSSSLSKPS